MLLVDVRGLRSSAFASVGASKETRTAGTEEVFDCDSSRRFIPMA
jgi:hypothetical protein